VEAVEGCSFLYLADGRLFVRSHEGQFREVDEFERSYVALLLEVDQVGTLDPIRGLEITPPSDN
jgi:hypothetical protein